MTYEEIVFAWNAQADEHNQYDTLSDRERIEFALMMATRQEQPIAKIVCGTGGGCSLEFTNGADSLDYAGCDVYLRPPIAQEPHPPTRHCMCDDCAPSFEQTPDGMAPAVTDAMALAFHSALTDSSIGQGEIDEIKTGLRAAICAANPVENQYQEAWMQNIGAAMKEPLFNELRALMGTENHGQDIALLQTIRRYRRKTLQAQERCNQEPVAFPDLPSGVVKHAELGDLFDRMQMHQYAMKYAMANNAAQAKSVEKQEPIDDLEDLLEEYWNLAYNEGKNKRVKNAGETLHQIRALFAAKQPCPECAHYISEIKRHQSEIDALNVKKFARFRNDECWIYQDDEDDHLESLTCPVVISPQQLIELRDKAAEFEAEIVRLTKLYDEIVDRCVWAGFSMGDSQDRPILQKLEDTYNAQQGRIKELEAECEKLKAERHELAAQVEKIHSLSEKAKSAHGWDEISSEIHVVLDEMFKAIALPDISTSILNRVRAEIIRQAAVLVIDLGDDSSTLDARTLTVAANAIRALGTGMEAGK